MYQIGATVTVRLQAMPDVWQVHLQAAPIARAAQPGQFVMALRNPTYDPYLRVAIPLHKIGEETIALLLSRENSAHKPLADSEIGATVDILGPLGHGFEIAAKTQHLLLIAQGLDIAPLVAAADRAVAEGRRVTLLAAARSQAGLYPTELLSRDIEYHGVIGAEEWPGEFRTLLGEGLDWADQVCAAGSEAMYRAIYDQLRTAPVHMRAGSVQVWRPGNIACGMGLCLACAMETRHGIHRACTEGPVWDLLEL